ncbi:ATP-binding protein (plasmid) [Paenibacillus thiaminolyticus]|uniref:ATP-binding protein n=1 Tax=Paenibacillus thiaminolyticus TaxID=49283 RepID=UPI00232F5844|nr:ATP-binding protein [Paenibacillus thiaminolyticus]WCF11658.1 ATP-binding protein [Paenibacillus thiaminolyticus]
MKKTKWIELIKSKYDAGITNAFLLTGNIGDYAVPGIMFVEYLIDELVEMGMDRVITLNYSEGSTSHQGVLREPEEGEQVGFDWDWSEMLTELRNSSSNSAYIIEYPEFLIPKASQGYLDDATKRRIIDLHKVMNDRSFLNSKNLIILVSETRSAVHEMFLNSNSRTFPIEVEFPNMKERLEMIRYLKTSDREVIWEITDPQFAKLTAGLSKVHLEDLYLLAEEKGILEKSMIIARKEELIKKEFGDVIEIFDADGYSLDDFSGQEHIKAYHREVVIEPILDGDISAVPKGLLYMGPPGTGKTYFSRCLAGEANINFVEFKMSKILDKYVGEAERNLEKAFNCFKSLAPVGVFIDEIDQALQRGGELDGNSVNKNIFGMFLAFLSDPKNRGQILWIGATNYPNKLDEALKRAGRFDKKIPFFPPTESERVAVFKYHLGKTGYRLEVNNYDKLAKNTEGYTQAEIENIVVKTVELAKRKKQSSLTDELVEYAMNCIISAQNGRIKEMIDIALDECNDTEFLPEWYKEEIKERRKTSYYAV